MLEVFSVFVVESMGYGVVQVYGDQSSFEMVPLSMFTVLIQEVVNHQRSKFCIAKTFACHTSPSVFLLITLFFYFYYCELSVQLASTFFEELLDSVIVDVASESHRIARLRLDRNLDEEEEELRLSAEARAKAADPNNSFEANSKYIVDIFGQTHPPVASEIFDCMNCGRSIMAGRFAPHLEKCMGKVIHLVLLVD